MASVSDIDPEKLDATTDEDIRRYKAAEGFDANYRPAGKVEAVETPAEIRARLGLTQEAFARALRIPVATLRNWEQGRKLPDPAARSLLNAVAREPEAVLRALGSPKEAPAKTTVPDVIPIYGRPPADLPRTRRTVVRVFRKEQAFAKLQAVVLKAPETALPETAWLRPGEITAWFSRVSLDDPTDKPH